MTIGKEAATPDWARAPRGGLRGLRPQTLPATFAGRPVRRVRVSRPAVPRTLNAFDVDDALQLGDASHELTQAVDVADSEVEHILRAAVFRQT